MVGFCAYPFQAKDRLVLAELTYVSVNHPRAGHVREVEGKADVVGDGTTGKRAVCQLEQEKGR